MSSGLKYREHSPRDPKHQVRDWTSHFFKLASTIRRTMQVNLSQQFEAESLKRMIDSTTDVHELQSLARELTDLYMRQRAATAWVVSEQ